MSGDLIDMQSAIVDAGKYDKLYCQICNTEMDVDRAAPSSHSYAGAVRGTNRVHDSFRCPNSNVDWHIQAFRLFGEARKTASKKLETMLREEANEILKTRVATKKSFY